MFNDDDDFVLKLMPLKIPAGWTVKYNTFGDVEPIVQNGKIENFTYYKQDLLVIEAVELKNKLWSTGEEKYVLDLGWYPDSDPNGFYRLTLLKENWDFVLFQNEDSDRYKIQALIDYLLSLISVRGIIGDRLTELLDEFVTE